MFSNYTCRHIVRYVTSWTGKDDDLGSDIDDEDLQGLHLHTYPESYRLVILYYLDTFIDNSSDGQLEYRPVQTNCIPLFELENDQESLNDIYDELLS